MKRLGKLAFGLFKVIVFILSFTLDVKVRADIKTVSLSGSAELEKSGQVEAVWPLHEYQEPLQFETMGNSKLRSYFNSVYLGLDEKTHIELKSTPEFDLFRGCLLIRVGEKISLNDSKRWFKVHTPHGDFSTAGSEFTVEVDKKRTLLSVISGSVTLLDRASGKKVEVGSGFEIWISGLTTRGEHTLGPLTALSFVSALKHLRDLSLLTDIEIQGKSDQLRQSWHQAAQFSSEQNQLEINRDLKKLEALKIQQRVALNRRSQNQAELKRYFRIKTLPTAETPDPAQLDLREPASLANPTAE